MVFHISRSQSCKLYCTVVMMVLSLTSLFAGDTQVPKVENGVLDLRGWDLQEDGKVDLAGDWEFYWNALVPPDSLDYFEPQYFPFPQLWPNESVKGKELSSQGFATYSLEVLVGKDEGRLALKIPDFYCAYALYLNGKLIAENGTVGLSKDTAVPQWLPMTINLPSRTDTLEFVLQVANFWHSKGGGVLPIVLGDQDRMQQLRRQEEGFDLILTGSLVMGGLFFVGLFWFGKHERPILFFSLYSLTYSYRVFGFGIYTFHSLYPEIPWWVTLHMEYISLFLSSLFFACYTFNLYPQETSKYFLRFAMGVCVLFMVITIFAPPLIFTRLIDPFFVVLSLSFLYIFYTYVLAVINQREGSVLSLMSTGVLLAVFGYNILIYYTIVPEVKVLTFLGYLSFFFLQSLILSFRFTRKLQRAKEDAERASKAKTDFLSMISHEIRTPLNAVIGLTNYLISDKPRTDQVGDLKTLKFSAENLYVLINDVLDYSKLEAGKLEFEEANVNVRELGENIVKAQESRAREKGIELSIRCDDDIPRMIICDGLRLSQILTNLVGNAVKFTEEGKVTLDLTRVAGTKKKVSIKFSIEDTGIGIPKEKQDSIFETFSQASSSTTRQYGGTGLGLSITKKILDIQNTELHLFSVEDIGSRFYFTQTFLVSEHEEGGKKSTSNLQDGLQHKKVLLVEDNAVNVMVAKKFLSRWQMNVEIAENGQEALELVVDNTYDLILMDLQMPVMDGYKATEELRRMGVEIPIIALTASAMLDTGDRVYSCGMNDFITKPFHPDDLYEKIKYHIKSEIT